MINIDDRVLDALNESEVFLCLQISRYMRSNRMTAWPSIETLATRCKWDERTVKRWRNSLEQKGFLEVKQMPGKSPTYRFKKAGFGVFHAMEEAPAQAENGGARNEGGTFYEGVQNVSLGGVQNMSPHPPQNLYPEVISKEVIKKLEVVRNEERENALPLPPVGENLTFGAKKENEPSRRGGAAGGRGGESQAEITPACPPVSDPYAWPPEAPAPAHVTTYAVPASETFDAAPGGPTYRAEVHAPAEVDIVAPKAKKAKQGVPLIVSQVIAYLNEKTGKAFKPETKGYDAGILARQKEGATFEEMQRVIDNRVAAWGASDKMRECLNPTTLFRPTNFANYLAEINAPKPVAVPAQPAQNTYGPPPTPTRLTPSPVYTRHRTMADFL